MLQSLQKNPIFRWPLTILIWHVCLSDTKSLNQSPRQLLKFLCKEIGSSSSRNSRAYHIVSQILLLCWLQSIHIVGCDFIWQHHLSLGDTIIHVLWKVFDLDPTTIKTCLKSDIHWLGAATTIKISLKSIHLTQIKSLASPISNKKCFYSLLNCIEVYKQQWKCASIPQLGLFGHIQYVTPLLIWMGIMVI